MTEGWENTIMDTNFNAALYQEEMLSLVNTAIKKLKAEHPDYQSCGL